jgi:nucleotide-binding universal stress UspA family protein
MHAGRAIDHSTPTIERSKRSNLSVAFPVTGDVRTEVEKAPPPFDEWWRARVRGGRRWKVPRPLPWSYGSSESVAVESALSLWVIAGQPRGRQQTSVVERGFGDGTRGASEAVPRPSLHEIRQESGATVLALGQDGETVVESEVIESVASAVRAVQVALDAGDATVVLTRRSGRRLDLPLGSVVGFR